MRKKTQVLVADRLPIFSAGVSNLLTDDGGFAVVEVQDIEAAVREASATPPDIALVDLDLPPAGGIAALSRIGAVAPDARMIVWSLNTSRDLILATIRAGASGFLHKGVSPEGLVRALRGVTRGEAPLSRHVTQMVIDALHGLDDRGRIRGRVDRLSEREVEVLELIARGARNREIAGALAISEFTVKRHVQNILQKLELSSRTAAGAFYRTTATQERPYASEGVHV